MRRLIERAGLTQAQAAKAIGITARTLGTYLRDAPDGRAPYAVQFALECLAATLSVPAPLTELHLVYNGLRYSWPLALTPP